MLEVKKMEKKDSNFSYDSIFTYADESKKYDTGKNTFNSAFQYNNVSKIVHVHSFFMVPIM